MTAMADPDFVVNVTLTYDTEGNQKLTTPLSVPLTITQELAGVFARAVIINEKNPPPLSFSSLLMGMMMGSDALSSWLKSHFESQGVTVDKIATRSSRSFDQADVLTRANISRLPALGTTISARRAIEQAQEVAAALGRYRALDIRHVASAYPILSDWHIDDFRELGIDRLEWARAYGAYMAGVYPAERRYWREYADRASPVPLTSFSADTYTEKDLLGIDRTVEALALLIASTRTDTPLSIGVFGQWGSGKSFFMQHLRRRIWNLAGREGNRVVSWIEKRKAGKATANDAPLYFSQIAQVEFNAWHYSEGNIVASLVDHLFRNLQVVPDASDPELEQRRAAVVLQISGAKLQVTAATEIVEQAQSRITAAEDHVKRTSKEVEEARKAVDTTSNELAAKTGDATKARQDLESAIQGVDVAPTPDPAAVAEVALQPLLDSPVIGQAKSAANALTSELNDWRRFVSSLLSVRGAVVIALCLVGPAVAWLANWLPHVWAAGAAVFSTAAATMTQVVGFIRERRKEFDSKMAELEQKEAERKTKTKADLRQQLESVQNTWKDTLASLQNSLAQRRAALAVREADLSAAVQSLADRTKELDDKVRDRAAAEQALNNAKAQLDKLSSTRLLDEFLKNRVGTDEYRKQLGFLALVRRDFERLSDLIARANLEWCDPAKTTEAPPLNRIVLYIDDLDRCSAKTVLKVLEVVHLLLAFRLFVCVVAVDPRWIEECLRQKHSYLFSATQNDGAVRVTVGDYLEKIFQIPIWTSPIESDQRASVVNALLGRTAAPAPQARGTSHPSPEPLDAPLPPDLERSAKTGNAFQVLRNKADEIPDPLQISSDETDFVQTVAGLLSDKPRALKRFVNTYRLLKASLPDIDRKTFVGSGSSSPHRICLTQLALFTGQPRLAPVFVRHLRNAADSSTLGGWFSKLDEHTRKELQTVFNLVPDRSLISVKDFCTWLPDTSKYLFHRDD
jgi:KAP family P-loop domain